MVEPQAFKDALSRLASGVTIVTTLREGGAPHGLTVSAFISVSLEPPRVLVSLANTADGRTAVERSGVFAVHVLGREHVALGPRFARMVPGVTDPFEGVAVRTERTGAPILNDCLAFVDCRVESALVVGDHTLFVGAVEAAGHAPGAAEPIVYYQRQWRVLDSTPVKP